MNLKLLACLACSAAFLLGACSSNNSTGTSSGGSGTGSGGGSGTGGDGNGDGNMESAAITAARTAVDDALTAAMTAARTGSEEDRTRASTAVTRALNLLDDVVAAAEKAVSDAEGGSALAIGAAARARVSAINFRRDQTTRLNDALASFSWFRRVNVRSTISRTMVVIPDAGANTVTIRRTPRTIPTSTTDETPKVNPDAIKSDTFEPVMYSDGKVLLAGSGRTASGSVIRDEFKVDGDVIAVAPHPLLDTNTYTGLTLTSTGLSIRVGGTRSSGSDAEMTDYTDMRKDITAHVDDADADGTPDETPRGRNAWDLAIAFDEPISTPAAGNRRTSWQGNGDFYWRGIVPADRKSQLTVGGDYYESDAFNQPTQPVDQRDLGTYEVWLSNHYDLDRKAEPTNPDDPAFTEDDVNRYLNYAAYGLFVYTASSGTFRDGSNGREDRVQSMSFGYRAFADEDGKRTKDIGTAISGGKFVGQTLATLITGNQSLGNQKTTVLRGEVSLTVTIPKGSETAGKLIGTLNGFEEWSGTYWQPHQPNDDGAFSVRLDDGTVDDSIDIMPDGSYSGTTTAINARTDVAGTFKGNFYGPRANADDLETAGTWNLGPGNAATPTIIGSFGAKQAPDD